MEPFLDWVSQQILYADDTLLILRTKEALEELLHEIELESEYYGLSLNLPKCELIEMNGNQDIEFRSGEHETRWKCKYLGGILAKQKTDPSPRNSGDNHSDHTSGNITWPTMEEHKLQHKLEAIDLPGGSH